MSEKKQSKEELKLKIAEEVEDLTDSEEDENDEMHVGFIEIKKAKKDWKHYYGIISGGSFFWYKDSRHAKPKGSIDLQNYTIQDNVEGQKKQNVIGLSNNDDKKETFYLACSSISDYKRWHSAILSAKDKKPVESPKINVEKRKKVGLGERAKKKMAGDIASSGLGKSVIKTILNDETHALLSAMKKIVARESSKKKAEELEKNIIKITVKAYLLINNKKLESDAFLKADKPLRQAFELMAKCYNHKLHRQVLEASLAKVETYLKEAEHVITELLQPHLTSKTMFMLASTFGYLGSVNFLLKAFTDETLQEELEKLVDAMEYYTQFHYN